MADKVTRNNKSPIYSCRVRIAHLKPHPLNGFFAPQSIIFSTCSVIRVLSLAWLWCAMRTLAIKWKIIYCELPKGRSTNLGLHSKLGVYLLRVA